MWVPDDRWTKAAADLPTSCSPLPFRTLLLPMQARSMALEAVGYLLELNNLQGILATVTEGILQLPAAKARPRLPQPDSL